MAGLFKKGLFYPPLLNQRTLRVEMLVLTSFGERSRVKVHAKSLLPNGIQDHDKKTVKKTMSKRRT